MMIFLIHATVFVHLRLEETYKNCKISVHKDFNCTYHNQELLNQGKHNFHMQIFHVDC